MRALGLLLVTTSFFSFSAGAAPVVVERLEASVNSSLILLSDVSRFKETEKLRSQLDPLFSGTAVAAKGANASNDEIVDFLINERLIAQAFPVTDAEVEQEITGIQSNNHLDRAALRHAIEEQGFSFDEYFELIRISASKRNLIDRDIRTKVTISDDDVKNYYYNHYSHDSKAPASFDIQIISISNKSYKSQAAAKETALKAAKQIQDGESFEEVAKAFSDDGSASAGGDLGLVTEDGMNPALRNEVKKMHIGQVSPVVTTTTGYAILKLKNIQTGDDERYEKMKEEIRNQLAAGEYQHQIQLWLERQLQTAFVHRAGQSSYSTISAPVTGSFPNQGPSGSTPMPTSAPPPSAPAPATPSPAPAPKPASSPSSAPSSSSAPTPKSAPTPFPSPSKAAGWDPFAPQ